MMEFKCDCGRRNYVISKCCVIFSVCTCISGEFHGNFSRYVNRSRIAKSTNHYTFLEVILRSRSKAVFQGLESKLDEQDVVLVQDKKKKVIVQDFYKKKKGKNSRPILILDLGERTDERKF